MGDYDILRTANTEISGNKHIVIDGCEGITDFTDSLIAVKSGKMKIITEGNNLKIKILTNHTIVIDGYINCVRFSYI